MNKKRIQELRKKLQNESISINEIIEIEQAFEKIPEVQLRDFRENATPDDMLDELERLDISSYTDDQLIARSEELKDLFTPLGNNWNELVELFEN